mmetsp:Transcript_13764/g.38966  ORF Transcript_13764/g.38966 Transcript_13764/m.38966 type:complete len:230 (-) Transcript_13764:116-805(-)
MLRLLPAPLLLSLVSAVSRARAWHWYLVGSAGLPQRIGTYQFPFTGHKFTAWGVVLKAVLGALPAKCTSQWQRLEESPLEAHAQHLLYSELQEVSCLLPREPIHASNLCRAHSLQFCHAFLNCRRVGSANRTPFCMTAVVQHIQQAGLLCVLFSCVQGRGWQRYRVGHALSCQDHVIVNECYLAIIVHKDVFGIPVTVANHEVENRCPQDVIAAYTLKDSQHFLLPGSP